jgi:hypothetical protein
MTNNPPLQTNPSLSEAVERVRSRVKPFDDANISRGQIGIDVNDLRTILQSLSVEEEVIARALFDTGINIGCSTWPDDQMESARELARTVLDTLGMANG